MKAVYYIKNTVNGKIYVGSSVNAAHRWTHHKTTLKSGTHKNQWLQADYNEFGLDVFEFGIIEEIEEKADLETREIYWIKRQKNCYNKVHWRPASRMGDMPKILKRIRRKGIEQARGHLEGE